MAKQDLRILKPLIVFGYAKMHLLDDLLNLLQQFARLIHIAGCVLLQAELGHLVNEFGVEETLLTRLCLPDSALQSSDCILIVGFFVR